jgi:hypothetical protein
MFMATPVTGVRGTVDPIPLDRLKEILGRYQVPAR